MNFLVNFGVHRVWREQFPVFRDNQSFPYELLTFLVSMTLLYRKICWIYSTEFVSSAIFFSGREKVIRNYWIAQVLISAVAEKSAEKRFKLRKCVFLRTTFEKTVDSLPLLLFVVWSHDILRQRACPATRNKLNLIVKCSVVGKTGENLIYGSWTYFTERP